MTPVRGKNEPLSWWMSYCLSCPWSTVLLNRGFHRPDDHQFVSRAMSSANVLAGAQESVRNAIARIVEGS